MAESTFLEHLREEKLEAQKARSSYAAKKLEYATALLGLGAITAKELNLDLTFVLYLVPLVAVVFDYYIIAEDSSVKRIGAYLRATSPDEREKAWEHFAEKHRDPFAPQAMWLLTAILSVFAGLIQWLKGSTLPGIILAFLGIVLAFYVNRRYWAQRRRFETDAHSLAQPLPVAGEPIRDLRRQLADVDHILTRDAFARLADYCQEHGVPLAAHKAGGKGEYLASVDAQGRLISAVEGDLARYHHLLEIHPECSQSWFQEAQWEGQPIQMPARWLGHLVGLRHRTVQLFIDHPIEPNYTLIQVRSHDKAEAPLHFDLPAAGHIIGTAEPQAALLGELKEELGLDPEDILDLVQIATYNYADPSMTGAMYNVEYRLVYRCRLREEALDKIAFDDGEVAAIAAFDVDELETLVETRPEQVASGLRASLRYYLATRSLASATSSTREAPWVHERQ
jgi:isopentenyldiphosphate isomerase